MSEFTGERVIPGLVDDNLFNEHVARYRFAARFSNGAAVLDAGCGSGYGLAELSGAASVTSFDIAAEAVRHARRTFARPGVRFLQASCEVFPFADAAFDLVTAFEVIEHLERWQQLPAEAARVLKPSGVLLVSTPNKAYYAESRAAAGPNPFHCHEFEYEEFEAALYSVFRHVRIWTQNHAEALVFAPAHPAAAHLDAPGDAAPEKAHFFLAACSQTPIASNDVYAWMPSTANLLREREHHIAKLEGELRTKDSWLQRSMADHARLQSSHEATLAELKQANAWAARLDEELAERGAEITRLQEQTELLVADLTARTVWARSLEEQLQVRTRHVQLQAEEIAEHNAHLERQAKLLEQYSERLDQLARERRLIANSKWLRLGRKLHLGPVVGE
ncbi:MAG: methyltransferase domain-containing protein [Acidobacteriota bacterium]